MTNELFPAPAEAVSRNGSELRCAVRFPLSLRVSMDSGEGDVAATTRNISAIGVLLELDQPLIAGGTVSFSLCMPGDDLGTSHDVVVHCTGRVVRCSVSQNQHYAAATIDEYEFVRGSENLAPRARA